MESVLIEYLNKNNILYISSENEELIEKSYNIFINNIIYVPELPIEYHYLGIYYRIHKDYDNMMLNLKIAAENDFSPSINALGSYYHEIGHIPEMKKYY